MDAVARLLVWLGLITSNRSNRGQTCPRFEGRAVGCAAVGELSGWEIAEEFHGAGRMMLLCWQWWLVGRSCKRAAARQRGSSAQVNGRRRCQKT